MSLHSANNLWRFDMEKRITSPIKLLDSKGNIACPGYATKMLFEYSRKEIKASKWRIKEWDYYYVGNTDYGVALTIADNSYMALVSVSLLDFRNGYQKTISPMKFFTKGKTNLPSSSVEGDVSSSIGKIKLDFANNGTIRRLTGCVKEFDNKQDLIIDITLSDFPQDSMVIATPFAKDKHFYYNQKINCMKASGKVLLGDTIYSFDDNNSTGLLDWGRGVWTYKNTWYWGSMSTFLPNGDSFGFNIGYGFGDTTSATENIIFYNGIGSKFRDISFDIPLDAKGKEDYMSPWTFTSTDSRLDMTFKPIMNRSFAMNLGILCSSQNQVFGLFSGKAILDDGREISFADKIGFAEKVFNKW